MSLSRRTLIGATSLAMAGLSPACFAGTRSARADFLKGNWGVMTHWIGPGPRPLRADYTSNFQEAVDKFELKTFTDTIARIGPSWVIFTIGQNSGLYNSPNEVLDKIEPGHTAKRDLVQELAVNLFDLGIKLILYLPSEVNASPSVKKAFGWNPADQRLFQAKYTDFVRFYSLKFGNACAGWFFDGCYDWPPFPNSARNWPLWCSSARAGNPQAAVTLNNGCFCDGILESVSPEQDFFAGEARGIEPGGVILRSSSSDLYTASDRWIGSPPVQLHALTPIDCNGSWGHFADGDFPPPRYSDTVLFKFASKFLEAGGGLTFNVGISQEGYISAQTARQLTWLKATRT